MPEIKNTFTQGKMNKDLDERLVPNGQYRDAMNVQLSSSDSSDVGAIENILGNRLLMAGDELGDSSYCVGTIADEKNNALYFLVAGPVYAALSDTISRDIIYKWQNNTLTPVVVDIYRIRTLYGDHDDTNNTLVVPPKYDGLGGFTPYNIEVGQHVQWDGHQRSFFGNNPVESVSQPDALGNVTIVVQNPFMTINFTTQDAQMGSFIFSNPGNTRVLNFMPGKLITGINILNEFLFFTDNFSEPKKININNCILGTVGINNHTRLHVPGRNINTTDNILIEQRHVTVIKQAPHIPLLVKPKYQLPITAKANVDFAPNQPDNLLAVGDEMAATFTDFGTTGNKFETGDEIRFLNGPGELPSDNQVRAIVIEDLSNQANYGGPPNPNNHFKFRIQSISSQTPVTSTLYDVEQFPSADSLFEKKFPRFSYRYKYQDGEYSTFAPFTDIIFQPGAFDYDSKVAYNKGMQNYMKSLELRGFLPYNLPEDVIQVDLLYKESSSPTVYIVDKIKYKDGNGTLTVNGQPSLNNWQANLYHVTSDLIYSVVPSNQLLRPWDNVPRVALAQEITGNRLVFANYLQNYNLDVKPLLESDSVARYDLSFNGGNFVQYELDFKSNDTDSVSFIKKDYDFGEYRGLQTLKSIRNYQIGLTYLDNYGRETPVFSNAESTFFIPKKRSASKQQIETKILTEAPSWASGFKFYVKETANEYYNLAMDRVYRAEDGNLWLSFPSSERNKVDEETFLYLKKQVDSNSAVPEQAKYKIISIENEAPEFIKTEIKLAGSSSPTETDTLLQTSPPVIGNRYFEIDEDTWVSGNNAKLTDVVEKLSLDFENEGFYTKKYDVSNIAYGASSGVNGGGVYRITLDRPLEANDQWIYPNYPTVLSNNIPDFGNKLTLRVYKHVTEAKPEFEGKFFVKINGDQVTEERLIGAVTTTTEYEVKARMNAYYLLDEGNPSYGVDDTTGVTKSDTLAKWDDNLDFNVPQDDVIDSEWFVDGTYYAMTHPAISGAAGSGNFVSDGNQNGGWGHGFKLESGGNPRWYIEVSHSKLSPDMDDEQCFEGVRDGNNANPGNKNYSDINKNYIWEVGSSSNAAHVGEKTIVDSMVTGGKFRFTGDTAQDTVNNTSSQIYTITEVKKFRRYNYQRWGEHFDDGDSKTGLLRGPAYEWAVWRDNNFHIDGGWDNPTFVDYKDAWERFVKGSNRRSTYRLYIDKDPTTSSSFTNGTETWTNPIGFGGAGTSGSNNASANLASSTVALGIEFITPRTKESVPLVSDNPAVWETEPKENIDLDIFHAASQVYPVSIDATNNELYIPKGSIVTLPNNAIALHNSVSGLDEDTTLEGWYNHLGVNTGVHIALSHELDLNNMAASQILKFTRHDNSYTTLTLKHLINFGVLGTHPFVYEVNADVSKNKVGLSWYNAFSFGNGVESDRLRDDFNQVKIDKGPIVSTILDTIYKEERRSSGLIYSGIYNSSSSVNSLNQFIQAEKITKDINPTYGTIQKLFSRNTDLVTFCEDRVIRIQANKDALFNADGNPQVVASSNVLGQSIPFGSDFGISKNPESFAVDNYRAYFTDKQKSSVLRLSKDGITSISEYGMSDWFGDNLNQYPKIVGSFDADKKNYNLTLRESHFLTGNKPTTLSYNENVKGWVSFKSFIPEQGVSMGNDYYTFLDGYIYKHHQENVNRNTFYNEFTSSSIDVLLNAEPSSIKNYQTLNYEGTKSKVTVEEVPAGINSNSSQGYKKLISKEGWNVSSIETNDQKGHINEFIEKEGKWFNFIKGNSLKTYQDIDTAQFSFQGIGRASLVPSPTYGCMDETALNYNANANIDDGSCDYLTGGCIDEKALNYNPDADFDNGTCSYSDTWNCDSNTGCYVVTDSTGYYSTYQNCVDSCVITCQGTYGCTDPNSTTYDPLADCDDGTCGPPIITGGLDGTIGSPYFPDVTGLCVDGSSPGFTNGNINKCDENNGYICCMYNPSANTDDYSCAGVGSGQYNGCMDPLANNFDPCADSDPFNSCQYDISGCVDPTALNYNVLANIDDGSCCFIGGCTDATTGGDNFPDVNGLCADGNAPSEPNAPFCDENNGYVVVDYDPNSNICFDDGSYCTTGVSGCTDSSALNYDPNANFDDGSCGYTQGCTDSAMWNYDELADIDDGSCLPFIYGCTDPNALNYNAYANTDDGSCNVTSLDWKIVPNLLHPGGDSCCGCVNVGVGLGDFATQNECGQDAHTNGTYGHPVTYYIDGVTHQTGSHRNYYVFTAFSLPRPDGSNCMELLGCYDIEPIIAIADGCTYYGCTDPDSFGGNNFGDVTLCVDDGSCIPIIYGCTDPDALNYYPGSNNDDGSCIYGGCIDPNACNYDPDATIDDGSCIYEGNPSCP